MKISVKDGARIALLAALTAAGAFVRIPIPMVPITMQVFFMSMAGVLLGSKKGALSQALYVIVGLAGIPIFTGGGGLAYIFKPTFGYLLGFIAGAYLTGLISEKMKKIKIPKLFLSIMAGVGVMYLIGVAYLYLINKYYIGKDFSLWMAIYYGFILTIGGDIVCSYFASVLCRMLLPVIKKS